MVLLDSTGSLKNLQYCTVLTLMDSTVGSTKYGSIFDFCEKCHHTQGYVDGTGSSGYTYKHGVKDAIERTSPAVFMFENVTPIADHRKDAHGRNMRPAIEVRAGQNAIIVQYITLMLTDD